MIINSSWAYITGLAVGKLKILLTWKRSSSKILNNYSTIVKLLKQLTLYSRQICS